MVHHRGVAGAGGPVVVPLTWQASRHVSDGEVQSVAGWRGSATRPTWSSSAATYRHSHCGLDHSGRLAARPRKKPSLVLWGNSCGEPGRSMFPRVKGV